MIEGGGDQELSDVSALEVRTRKEKNRKLKWSEDLRTRLKEIEREVVFRDGNGWGRDEFHNLIPIPIKKKLSPSSYLNPTGIKLLSHPHFHRVRDILVPIPSFLTVSMFQY